MQLREQSHSSQEAPLSFAVRRSSLGQVVVGWSERGIVTLLLGDDVDELTRELFERHPSAQRYDSDDHGWVDAAVRLLEDPRSQPAFPLDATGTPFQQSVWRALCEIPCGETVSYRELARRLGAPNSTRAVAGACAANWIAVAIPCHRVVRSDGSLSGYRWGVERKRQLLSSEGAENYHA